MKFLSKALTTFQRSARQHDYFLGTQKKFSSNAKPIKMSFTVFETNGTDANIPPVIIMHGLFGARQCWRTTSKAMSLTTKRKIYSVDARNHGESPHTPEHTSEHMGADIAFLMQEENLKRVTVMGHCMGGRTMMYFALLYPELVEKAIIVDISPISVPRNFETINEIFHAMKNVKIPPNLTLPEARALAGQQILKYVTDKDIARFVMMNLIKLQTGEFTWRLNISALHENFQCSRINQDLIRMPPFSGSVLFIAGKASKFVNPADWPKIKVIFPNSTLEWIDTGHLVHAKRPEKFLELVTSFLAS